LPVSNLAGGQCARIVAAIEAHSARDGSISKQLRDK
jgi:hypothetical protein